MEKERPKGWTTLEESKELKKLGLGKETNDLWYSNYCLSVPPNFNAGPTIILRRDKKKISPVRLSKSDIPAWSLGALIKFLPPYLFVYDKEGGHDVFFKLMNGAAWYEYWDGEKYVRIWEVVEALPISAVIEMVKFMLSHPDIIKTKTANL